MFLLLTYPIYLSVLFMNPHPATGPSPTWLLWFEFLGFWGLLFLLCGIEHVIRRVLWGGPSFSALWDGRKP
jgi:hypothetical protein